MGSGIGGTQGYSSRKTSTDVPSAPSPVLQPSSAALRLGQLAEGPVLGSVAPVPMASGPALSVEATASCLGAVSPVAGIAVPAERPRPGWVAPVSLRKFRERTWLWAHPRRKP